MNFCVSLNIQCPVLPISCFIQKDTVPISQQLIFMKILTKYIIFILGSERSKDAIDFTKMCLIFFIIIDFMSVA